MFCSAVGDLFCSMFNLGMAEASKSANQFALFLCRVVTDMPLLRELRFIFSRTIVDLGRPGLHDYLTRRFIAQ